jgi:hypothetical protein
MKMKGKEHYFTLAIILHLFFIIGTARSEVNSKTYNVSGEYSPNRSKKVFLSGEEQDKPSSTGKRVYRQTDVSVPRPQKVSPCSVKTGDKYQLKQVSLIPCQSAVISSVFDAYTLKLDNGKLMRLRGVISPDNFVEELNEQTLDFIEKLCTGKKAGFESVELVSEKNSNLKGYVFLADRTFVNLELVRYGLAVYSPDSQSGKYAYAFRVALDEAKRNKRGVWKK